MNGLTPTMDLVALAREIKDLRYVILRNWDKMPPDGDIDFWVHPDDRNALRVACNSHLPVEFYDIWSVDDNYFPAEIAGSLLEERERFGEWYVLTPPAHFMTLYYHGLVHKGDDRYVKKLAEIFLAEFPPVRPNDPGVGFHDPR